MSFVDIFLTQLSTFSYDDVEKVYYKVTEEREKRVKNKIANDQKTGLEKVESVFPNLYKTCVSIKVVRCEKHGINIEFTPKPEYVITGNFGNGKRPLEVPYSISLQKAYGGEGYESTVDLNKAGSCTSYPDLWYSYRSDAESDAMYPYKCNRGRCEKYVPSQLMDLELINQIINNPKKVWDSLIN